MCTSKLQLSVSRSGNRSARAQAHTSAIIQGLGSMQSLLGVCNAPVLRLLSLICCLVQVVLHLKVLLRLLHLQAGWSAWLTMQPIAKLKYRYTGSKPKSGTRESLHAAPAGEVGRHAEPASKKQACRLSLCLLCTCTCRQGKHTEQ